MSVFRWERIPRQADGRVANAFLLAPDWTIEILSPGQSQSQVIRNNLHCLECGTEMGWLLDAAEFCIFVYNAAKSAQVFDAAEARLPVPVFAQAVQLTTGQIFDWLKE